MELLVAGALGIVIYCSYLTVRDTFDDLRREGILKSLSAWCDGNFGFPRRALVPVRVRRDGERYHRGHF